MDEIKVSRPKEIPGAEVWRVQANNRAFRHFHESYDIASIDSGIGYASWRYRGENHFTRERQTMLTEPGEMHTNLRPVKGTFHVLYLKPSSIEKIAREYGLPTGTPHFTLGNVPDFDIYQAFWRLHISLENENSSALETTSRLVFCIGMLFSRYIEEKKAIPCVAPRNVLRRARDFIMDNILENVSLDQLAQISGLSRFHLLRAFSREFGMPPHSYQIQVRLTRAMQQIVAGVPLSELEVGFSDQSHLTRHFKKLYGITPAQYAGAELTRKAIG